MKSDKKVVIVTHGHLADGLVSALQIIVGELPQVKTVCGYTSSDFNLDETVQEIMNNHNFETHDLVVCTDMMGGSVNSGFVKYLGQYPFHLITNVNLLFLVDLLLTPGGIDEQILISKVNDSLVSVKYVNQLIKDLQDCDEL